jgi:DNA-binding transcriptional regulator LsrR (DeoR family)
MPIPAQRRAPRPTGGADIVIETAWLYYHDGLNQNEIAGRLDVSRASVVNYLQEARERGLVQVRLAAEAFTGHEAALRLCATFGLTAAYVLPDGATAAETEARVCRGAADWLPRLVAPGDRLGIAWGKTIYDVAEYLEPHAVADMTVLQLVGSMATPYGFSADVCSSNVARRFSARCVNLHVPAVLSDAKLAGLLRQETLIARQLEDVSRPTKTAFATGSCTPESHVVSSGVASLADLDWYLARGAVGVLCGRFIDAAGDPVPGPLDARMMGVELDRLRRPEVGLLVCPAAERVTATVAALRGGYATHVVTHVEAAEAMLAHA